MKPGVTSPVGRQAVKGAAPLLLGEPGSWRGVSGEALTKERERELALLNVTFRHVFIMIDPCGAETKVPVPWSSEVTASR